LSALPVRMSVHLMVVGIAQTKDGLCARRRLVARPDVKKSECDNADFYFLLGGLLFGLAVCLPFPDSPHVPRVFLLRAGVFS
jgi:hypothetical protein